MKVIHNTRSGHTYTLLRTAADTNGASLEMEVVYPANSAEPPAHYHPLQAEHFRVRTGELAVRMNGHVRTLRAGDTVDVPANTVHSMWNDTSTPVVLEWIVSPALETEHFFDTFAELANDGRTNDKGVPNLLQLSLVLPRFYDEFRLASPPFWAQRLLWTVLAPIARLTGHSPA